MTAHRRRLTTAVATALLLVACAEASGDADTSGGQVTGQITVFAAASLTDAFDELAAAFVERHEGVSVVLNHAGSQTLASQITEGAPADVFASANVRQMEVVDDAGLLAGPPRTFASNTLEIAVEPGNPLAISGLADLAAEDLLLVLPTEEVPAGRYAREALDAAAVTVAPASLERDVRAALGKVGLGEADASIVYGSDVAAADGRVDGVAIPPEDNVAATYPVAMLADAPNPRAGEAFVAFLLSEDGRAILSDAGFGAP